MGQSVRGSYMEHLLVSICLAFTFDCFYFLFKKTPGNNMVKYTMDIFLVMLIDASFILIDNELNLLFSSTLQVNRHLPQQHAI